MSHVHHGLEDLYAQLGLNSDAESILLFTLLRKNLCDQ